MRASGLIASRLLVAGMLTALTTQALADTVDVERVSAFAGLHLEVSSAGVYSRIQVTVRNTSRSIHTVRFRPGAFFESGEAGYQDLAVVTGRDLRVRAGATETVAVDTACMDPAKRVASSDFASWTARYDGGLGPLLVFIDMSRMALAPFVDPGFFSSPEKIRQFKQGVIWVYYDASKDRMTSFAAQHMFGGDQAKAASFVSAVYPAAKKAIDIYKATQGG